MATPQVEIKMTEDLIKELKYRDIDPDDVAEQLLEIKNDQVSVGEVDIVRVGNVYDLDNGRGVAAASDSSAIGYGFLGFFVPVVGLILFLTWKDQYPARSKAAGVGALASLIAGVVFFIIYIIVIVAAVGSATSSLRYY
ncbi:hypothetical protein FACS189431_1510 [Alphaproteobacteria bacterium]|nr:hypothetical protein FACS189431_1510 [Alphaproteobacteria bacterium]